MSKLFASIALVFALFTAPVLAQEAPVPAPSCVTSQDIQKMVTDNQTSAVVFVRSMTAEEVATVSKNVSIEYNIEAKFYAIDIYEYQSDPSMVRIVIFDEKGCYSFDFPDTLAHTLKLLEASNL